MRGLGSGKCVVEHIPPCLIPCAWFASCMNDRDDSKMESSIWGSLVQFPLVWGEYYLTRVSFGAYILLCTDFVYMHFVCVNYFSLRENGK